MSEGAAGQLGRTRRRAKRGDLRTRCVVVQVKPVKQVKPAFSEPTTEQAVSAGQALDRSCPDQLSQRQRTLCKEGEGCLCHRAVLRIHCVRTHKGAQQASVLRTALRRCQLKQGSQRSAEVSTHGSRRVRSTVRKEGVLTWKSSSSRAQALAGMASRFRPARSSGLRLGKNKKQHTQCLPVYSGRVTRS